MSIAKFAYQRVYNSSVSFFVALTSCFFRNSTTNMGQKDTPSCFGIVCWNVKKLTQITLSVMTLLLYFSINSPWQCPELIPITRETQVSATAKVCTFQAGFGPVEWKSIIVGTDEQLLLLKLSATNIGAKQFLSWFLTILGVTSAIHGQDMSGFTYTGLTLSWKQVRVSMQRWNHTLSCYAKSVLTWQIWTVSHLACRWVGVWASILWTLHLFHPPLLTWLVRLETPPS